MIGKKFKDCDSLAKFVKCVHAHGSHREAYQYYTQIATLGNLLMKKVIFFLLLLPLMSLAATYTHDGFVPTTKTKLWSGFSATDIVSATGCFCSEWVDSPCDEAACNLKKDGTSITVQFQHLEGMCLKCVGVKFFTESDGVYAQAIYSRYVNGAEKRGIDFDTCSYYSNTPGASEGWDRGYCVKNLRVTVATTGVIGLAHRWSFNGDLTDSAGGQTATAVGSVTTDGAQYTLAGGSRGSSYINLGSNILPNDGSGVTLEVWGTQKSVKKCGRIWDIGGNTSSDMLMAWTCQSDINADGICIRQIGGDQLAKLSPYTLGTEFHVATVFKPQADGTWKVYYYKQDASTGATLASATLDSKGTTWSLTTQNQTDCWLGHSHWSDNNDANASYNEVRVWKRALTEAELTANALLGPDMLPGGSSDSETPIYTITFDANGGTPTPTAITRKEGEAYGTLPTATRSGYVFDGWYTAASGGTHVVSKDVVVGNVTLFAQWSRPEGAFLCTQYEMKSSVSSLTTAKSYIANSSKWKSDPVTRAYSTVAFSDDDSSVRDFETVAFPGNETKEDGKDNFVMVATGKVIIPESGEWSFACGTDDGFELTLTGGGESYVMSYESTRGYGNSVLTFTMAAGVYDLELIYFDSTGGADCLLSAAKGRYSSFSGYVFKLIGNPKCDVVSTLISPDPICTIAFNVAGGSPVPAVITRKVGEPYGALPELTRDWFVFDGWYTEEDGGERVDATTSTMKDALLHAHWKSAMARLSISDITVLSDSPWKDVLIGYKVVGAVDDAVELRVSARDNVTGKTYTCKTIDGADLTEGNHILKWRAQEDGATFRSDDVVFTLNAVALPSKYRVIDLSGGASATSYPVTDLEDVPSGGWSDEYKTTKLVLRRIEPGSFIMDEDQTVEAHRVTLTKPFYMGVFEITQKQWELVMESNPSEFSGDMHPVECVSYYMIRGRDAGSSWPQTAEVDDDSFIGKLRDKTGLFVDLPTEAQWEYACRAGTTTTYYWGDYMDYDYVWCVNNSESTTHVVGTRRPNAWGLYDMSGNVWEWNLDGWENGRIRYGVDPKGIDEYFPLYRVCRGGSWELRDYRYCGSAWREGSYAVDGGHTDGFRLVAASQEIVNQTVAISKSFSINTMVVDEGEWIDGALDICSGARRTSEAQQLTMSPEWEDNGVKAIISVDGVPYQEAASAGECTWAGPRTKEYTLTHQVVDADGAAVGEPYVAKFNWINRVTVTFECQNGEAAITKTYDEASAYGELPVVSRTGYAFDGWYTAASGGTKVSETDIVPGAMTFYAHWVNNRYSIRFHANGGEGQMEDQSFGYDNAQDLSATAFTRTGYTFAGWATSAGGQVAYGNGQSVKNLTTAANGSVDLYAIWNKNTYSVKFNANGGSGSMANEAMTYDAEKTLTLCAFTRTGYTFAGWATTAGGAVVYVNGQSVKNLTATQGAVVNLYAKWTANEYAVKFNANGGSGTMANEPMTYDAEKALTACAFTRTGYTFAGWATSAGGAVKYANGAAVKNLTATAGGTVTLYAKWTPNNYVIDFNPGQGGEGSMSDQPMTYDEAEALYPNLFHRTGYTFLGWTDDPNEVEEVLYYDGVVVENLTDEVDGEYDLYAVWAANEYTVRFDANGGKGSMADQAFLYDEEQGLTSNGFTRAGCEFLGWTRDAATGMSPPQLADAEVVSNLTAEADGVVTLYAVWDGTATTWMEDDSFSAAVANTYDGYLIDEDYNLFGIVQVKTTKQTVKKTTDRVTKVVTVTTNITATATVTDANGKKWSYTKGSVELVPAPRGEDAASTMMGVVSGLKCATKGCLVPEFGVKVGANGMDGEWGEYAIFGARNGMGIKGDEMMADLEAYKGKWSVTMKRGEDAASTMTVRLQLDVQAKGVVKIAGNWESGAKVSASAQLVMGDGFVYVPVMVKSTKTSPALNALLRIDAGGEVSLLGEGSAGETPPPQTGMTLVDGGRTVAAIEIVGYLAENPVKAGAAYVGRVALNELAYPAKFTQKGLPTGLKIDAATGVVSGTPTKPGEYEVTFTATSSMNSKSNDAVKVTIKVENYVDGLIPVEDYYGPYTPGVLYTVTIPAADGCTVSGMPTGMKWTAKDVKAKDGTVTTPANSIYGIPTKPGKYTVYFKKSVSEVNEKGKSVKVTHTATATFEVADYPTITLLPSLAVAGSEPMAVTEGAALSFFVGVKQSFAINLAGTLDGVDTTVSAKGLPSGLKLVKKTVYVDPSAKKKVVDHYEYVIEGVPTKASSLDKQKNVVPSHVTLTASNKYKWSGTFAFDITVVALPTWAYGTFDGGNTNGMATLTVSNVGKLSGKWMSEGLTWTLSSASYDAYYPNQEKYVATAIGKSGKFAMTNEIEVTESGVVASDARGEDAASTVWEAWRNGWKEEPFKMLAKDLKGKTVSMTAPRSEGAAGTVELMVGASGAVTAKGTFVTGFDEKRQKDIVYSASCSTVLIPMSESGQYRVYLYFPPKSGKFDGFADVVELEWNGVELKP